jgi:hypothetical protein
MHTTKASHTDVLTERLATNIIVSSMLILGGSATVASLTGMHTIAVSAQADSNVFVAQIMSV